MKNKKEKIKEYFKDKNNIMAIITSMIVFTLIYISVETLCGVFSENISNLCLVLKYKKFNLFTRVISEIDYLKFVINYLIIIVIYLLLKSIIGSRKITIITTTVICYIYAVMNYVVTQVRGISITISDVYSIPTALGVAKGIKIDLDVLFFISSILIVIAILLCTSIKNSTHIAKKRRLINFITGIILFVGIINMPYMDNVAIWDINSTYEESGTGATILKMIKEYRVHKPKGYNKNEVKQLLDRYSDDEIKENDVNVIVIMNESFADLEKIYDLNLSEDNIPFFHSLENEVRIGKMHSSKYGGGTANVEYEFLTQNTTAFLPVGSMPYQQYIRRNIKSIVSHMNDLEYNTLGIHPWYKHGYSRGKIYKYLGFKDYKFIEDMPEVTEDQNTYPSDEGTYNELMKVLEDNKDNSQNIFSFVLTMQNHLPYGGSLEGGKQYIDDEEINNYLQLENKSDEALKKLITYLKEYNKKTILIFYGDHQPNLNLDEKYDYSAEYDEEEAKYIVPYFIWTNYETNLNYPDEISTNYMQSVLIENANIRKDNYINYMLELRKDIPIITTQYYIDREGNKYLINDKTSPYYDKLLEYQKVVYYKMFDEK